MAGALDVSRHARLAREQQAEGQRRLRADAKQERGAEENKMLPGAEENKNVPKTSGGDSLTGVPFASVAARALAQRLGLQAVDFAGLKYVTIKDVRVAVK